MDEVAGGVVCATWRIIPCQGKAQSILATDAVSESWRQTHGSVADTYKRIGPPVADKRA